MSIYEFTYNVSSTLSIQEITSIKVYIYYINIKLIILINLEFLVNIMYMHLSNTHHTNHIHVNQPLQFIRKYLFYQFSQIGLI